MNLAGIIVFISSFLLFQIEMIVGKIFLPNFGGSYLVWGACVVFFQLILMLGYAYAYGVLKKIGIKKYSRFHVGLLLIPFLFFPGKLINLKLTLHGLPMVLEVFAALLLTIGPAFFVLSTMSIVWQDWVAHSPLSKDKNPYVLFGISNFASFVALLTYPFIFEMQFDLNMQQSIWRWMYVVLVILQFIALSRIKVSFENEKRDVELTKIPNLTKVIWCLYGAGGVAVFLSVTHMLTAEIAPFPLLWVIPLGLYLLSFTLTFQDRVKWPAFMEKVVFVLMGVGVVFYFALEKSQLPILGQIGFLFVFTLLVCVFAQAELYRLRPKKESLPFYYLIISLGGLIGGVFVTWIVPLISSSHLEFLVAIFLVSVARMLQEIKKGKWLLSAGYVAVFLGLLIAGPHLMGRISGTSIIAVVIIVAALQIVTFKSKKAFVALLLVVMLAEVPIASFWRNYKYIFKHRNYYGVNKIFDKNGIRFLVQSTTIHGAQLQDPKKQYIPLTYYNPKSPSAEILIQDRTLKNIAVVGLGAGSLAPYFERGQSVDFFELDPDVLMIAKKYFSFLEFSPAMQTHVIGDARVSLENSQKIYDLIIVDAFSGDSVPVHLVTQEAIEIYRKHLSVDGMLVFHLTNRYIDLITPFSATIQSLNGDLFYKRDDGELAGKFISDWVAVTWSPKRAVELPSRFGWKQLFPGFLDSARPWSDAYNNFIPYIKFQKMMHM